MTTTTNIKERINFGKGNVIVTSTINALIIKIIDRPLQVGDMITNGNTYQPYGIMNQFTIPFSNYVELQEFKKLLLNVYEDKVFDYKYLTLDFSEYNRKSVDCIIDQLSWIEKFMPKVCVV